MCPSACVIYNSVLSSDQRFFGALDPKKNNKVMFKGDVVRFKVTVLWMSSLTRKTLRMQVSNWMSRSESVTQQETETGSWCKHETSRISKQTKMIMEVLFLCTWCCYRFRRNISGLNHEVVQGWCGNPEGSCAGTEEEANPFPLDSRFHWLNQIHAKQCNDMHNIYEFKLSHREARSRRRVINRVALA